MILCLDYTSPLTTITTTTTTATTMATTTKTSTTLAGLLITKTHIHCMKIYEVLSVFIVFQ